jgi:hypothetical protein
VQPAAARHRDGSLLRAGAGLAGAWNTGDMVDAVGRFEVAVELHRTGVLLMEQNLRRRYPDESDDEIRKRLVTWLRTRPGAEHGDGPQPGS